MVKIVIAMSVLLSVAAPVAPQGDVVDELLRLQPRGHDAPSEQKARSRREETPPPDDAPLEALGPRGRPEN